MRRASTANQRQKHLDALRASGETVTQWCNRNGLHRTTVYRWLRQETKNKAINTGTSIIEEKLKGQSINPTPIKWLPVTEKSKDCTSGYRSPEKNHMSIDDKAAKCEIQVLIGRFTVNAPDGFHHETFKSVCKALLEIC